jgi:hypothetical protein
MSISNLKLKDGQHSLNLRFFDYPSSVKWV